MAGLLDALMSPNGGLAQGMQSPLFNLGAGLIAGAQPFQNPGAQLQGAGNNMLAQQQARQQLQMGQLQQAGLLFQLQQAGKLAPLVQQYLAGTMGGPQGAPQPQQQGLLQPPGAQPSGAVTTPLLTAPGPAPGAPTTAGTQPGGLLSAQPPASPSAASPAAPPSAFGADAASDRGQIMRDFNAGIFMQASPYFAPIGQAIQKKAEFEAQSSPALATEMSAAKNEYAQAQLQIGQAMRGGNPALANQLYLAYLSKAGLIRISNNNGTVTSIGGIPLGALGIETTSNGQITKITPQGAFTQNLPGETRAIQERAAAEAQGKATGELTEVTDSNGNKYRVPVSTLLGNGGNPAAPNSPAPPGVTAAPNAPPGGNLSQVGPAQAEMLKGNAETALENNKSFQKEAEDGKDMVATVQTIKNDARDFSPGRFANIRTDVLDYLRAANLATPDQLKALGSAQSGAKLSIQLQALVTKALGSREAQQIFDKMGKSIPGLTLSPDGLSKIAAWQEGMARYKMARAAQANAAAQANDYQGVNNTRDTWIKNSNPLFYVMASSDPATQRQMIQSMRDAKGFLRQWAAAQRAGFAPGPNEYGGQ